ncbi:hypothetical protein J31TS6_43470 [Brevibacillus reuszeri]|uniref:DUF3951 domain-containing protein n=1 Tax=Brevibacillus reuszeri TaxID=54915 RepID=UPI001B067B80|nr:DUF3951 domain-containing protein [Brevibacillus reuszeri]GIO08319.1 hypothetical protein J31TS6_43470 [Brevibacillus reuszeri]
MYIMFGLIIAVSLLIFVTLGMASYQFFIKKKTVEHYYTPLDRMFGQTPIEFHEEKIAYFASMNPSQLVLHFL